MSYHFYYIIFGILPSFIWLLFYLRKDSHPESNLMILKIFFYGMLIALPVIFLQIGTHSILKELKLSLLLFIFLDIFIKSPLSEEFLKYLVVKEKVLSHQELDEPVDIMLYMIIAALGFAAAENILYLFDFKAEILESFYLSSFRGVGAIFLHTLCSGTLGYFLALSIHNTKKRGFFLIIGLGIATLLHGLFNFSIIKIGESFVEKNKEIIMVNPLLFFSFFVVLITVLIGQAIFLFFAFKRLKKIKSVCKI